MTRDGRFTVLFSLFAAAKAAKNIYCWLRDQNDVRPGDDVDYSYKLDIKVP